MKASEVFPYKPGESFKRAEMHKIVGGSFRHGMTSCSNGSEFLLFHDKKKSKKYGYDIWEGLQADGSFHYSGQGIEGDQSLTKSNLALVKADLKRLPIHLIESIDGTCFYLGKFILGSPKYIEQLAPDKKKSNLRKIFLFNLIPIESSFDLDLKDHEKLEVHGRTLNWQPPEFSTIVRAPIFRSEAEIHRFEFELQSEFGSYLINKGHDVCNYEFFFSGLKGSLKPDFWIPCLSLVVEAKPSHAREYVRLGIGQVLDYANLSRIRGFFMNPALLLPSRPAEDLVELIKNLNITLIYKKGEDFIFISP